jgi:hypothetical protein
MNPVYLTYSYINYQNLGITLIDGGGNRATVAAADVGNEALAQPMDLKFILNQVRFPLDGFAGVDLTDVVAVELSLSYTEIGVIDVADVAFTRGA